jgi:hypothetical protein
MSPERGVGPLDTKGGESMPNNYWHPQNVTYWLIPA